MYGELTSEQIETLDRDIFGTAWTAVDGCASAEDWARDKLVEDGVFEINPPVSVDIVAMVGRILAIVEPLGVEVQIFAFPDYCMCE